MIRKYVGDFTFNESGAVRHQPNICLTCNSAPEGLGVKIAERSDSNFHDKGIIRLKQLLGLFYDIFILYIISKQ
jgi:hypothetical protein